MGSLAPRRAAGDGQAGDSECCAEWRTACGPATIPRRTGPLECLGRRNESRTRILGSRPYRRSHDAVKSGAVRNRTARPLNPRFWLGFALRNTHCIDPEDATTAPWAAIARSTLGRRVTCSLPRASIRSCAVGSSLPPTGSMWICAGRRARCVWGPWADLIPRVTRAHCSCRVRDVFRWDRSTFGMSG
jgi:hypothetical protein